MSAADPARLSVAVLVRDDAEGLRETLACVAPWADQLVVLDTGSVDSSRDEARAAGAELHECAWIDDFSAARNACLAYVRSEWVLWLDAGETLTSDDLRQLRSFLQTDAEPNRVYALAVKVPPPVPQAAPEQVARVRLHRRHPQIQFSGRIRESLGHSLQELGWSIDGLPFRIQRSTREHEAARKRSKARRNIRIAEIEIREKGAQPHLLNCLGDAAQSLDENERAAQFFQQAITTATPGSIDMLEGYYGLLTSLDGNPANRQLQLDLAVHANETFPLDAQLLCALGGYLQALGRIDLAQQSYETAFRFGQINPAVWHVAEVRDVAAICLSITWQLRGRLVEAQRVLEEALTAEHPSPRVRRHLIELLVRQAKRDEALAASRHLPRDTPQLEALRSAIRGACLAVEKNWIAAKAYLRTAYESGCRDVLCLRWYAITLLAEGQGGQAREVLQIWQRFDPQNPELRKLWEATAEVDPSTDAARQIRIDSAGSHPKSSPASAIRTQPTDQR